MASKQFLVIAVFGLTALGFVALPSCGAVLRVRAADTTMSLNIYPDFSASPSTNIGCVGLTSTVSPETGV